MTRYIISLLMVLFVAINVTNPEPDTEDQRGQGRRNLKSYNNG